MTLQKAPMVVLTGANGYLGKLVFAALKTANVKVESFAFRRFLSGGTEFSDLGSLKRADVICHLAALHPHQSNTPSDGSYWDVNVEGTKKLLAASRIDNRIVFASSAMAIEDKASLGENQGLLAYASSKRAAEALVGEHSGSSHSLRLQAIAGAHREPCVGLIGNALRAANDGTPLMIFRQAPPREYLHVADAAAAVVAACLTPFEGHAVIDIGSGIPQRVSTVVATVERVTGRTIKRQRVTRRIEPTPQTSDLSAAERLLRWQPCKSSISQIVADQWQDQQKRQTSHPLTSVAQKIISVP